VTGAGPATSNSSGPVLEDRLPGLAGRYGEALLWLVVIHALITAALRLGVAFPNLLFHPVSPFDVVLRHDEVVRWFSGEPVYGTGTADYPPASYVLLWPLLGWLPHAQMRLLFGLSTAASLAAIVAITVRASAARLTVEKLFIAFIILSLGGTFFTVWLGQLGLHATAALLAAAVILHGSRLDGNGRNSLAADLAASALLTFALVKPTVSAPVAGVILVLTGRLRPAVLVGALYMGLTLLAAAFQDGSVISLIAEWLSLEGALTVLSGTVNISLWLSWLGYQGPVIPFSMLILGALVAWAWRHRNVLPLQVLAVSALASRLWFHHRDTDDVVLVIVAVALFNAAKEGELGNGRALRLVAAVLLAGMYVLGHGRYPYFRHESPLLWLLTEVGRTVVWLAALAFLLWRVPLQREAGT
jgi:hypothetical protein